MHGAWDLMITHYGCNSFLACMAIYTLASHSRALFLLYWDGKTVGPGTTSSR